MIFFKLKAIVVIIKHSYIHFIKCVEISFYSDLAFSSDIFKVCYKLRVHSILVISSSFDCKYIFGSLEFQNFLSEAAIKQLHLLEIDIKFFCDYKPCILLGNSMYAS